MIDIAQAPALYRQALDTFDKAFSGDGAPTPFAELRRTARDRFEALGIPTKREEAWKYTDLRTALAHDYTFAADGAEVSASEIDALAIADLDAARIVLVDGHVRSELSDLDMLPEGVTVGSLREAAQSGDAVVAQYFGKYADVDADAFAALNTQFDLDGLFLSVSKGIEVGTPIHVVHLLSADRPTFAQTRHLVALGANARATLVETYATRGGDAATFRNDLTEVVVGAGARFEHTRIQDEGDAANAVTLLQVYQERDSHASSFTYTFASGTVRNNYVVVPNGEGCTSDLSGVYICHGDQHVDTHSLVDHVAPNCQSNELFKGILYDRSTGVFNGKVFVHRAAQLTNAYQQSQGVVLSPDAHHFSKPELEIYADDVKCSHGSTTGSVEPEHVFYLRSRGVSESDARAMLLYAFAHDVVEQMESEPLRAFVDAKIAERLK